MSDDRRTARLAKLSILVDRSPPISGRRLKRRFPKVRATEGIPIGNLLDNAAIAELLIRAQARRILAINPEWNRLLKGDLQMHTLWSDGSGTISEMAEAATERGYQYIAITDHTKGTSARDGDPACRLLRLVSAISASAATLSRPAVIYFVSSHPVRSQFGRSFLIENVCPWYVDGVYFGRREVRNRLIGPNVEIRISS